MSLRQSVLQCKKHISKGYMRKVYYSPTYDVIIKRQYYCGYCQNETEAKLLKLLTDEEKTIIPLIEVIRIDDEPVIIMKRVTPLEKIISFDHELHDEINSWWYRELGNYKRKIMKIIKSCNLIDNSELFLATVMKYEIDDLKLENLGILNNQLVILDAGWNSHSDTD